MMMEKIKEDLKRYMHKKEPGKSALLHYGKRLPVLLLHEGAICVVCHRFAEWFFARKLKFIAFVISKLVYFVTGNYIHPETRIGPGCKLNHGCIAIHAQEIGEYFECSQNITVGQKNPYASEFPVIGNFVMLSAGARVFDDLGDEVIVGSNAVVIKKVEDGCVVGGVPAQIVSSSEEYMKYYKRLCRQEDET